MARQLRQPGARLQLIDHQQRLQCRVALLRPLQHRLDLQAGPDIQRRGDHRDEHPVGKQERRP